MLEIKWHIKIIILYILYILKEYVLPSVYTLVYSNSRVTNLHFIYQLIVYMVRVDIENFMGLCKMCLILSGILYSILNS